jgi:hypothetical protein
MIRRDLEQAVERVSGFVGALLLLQDDTAVVQRLRISGLQGERGVVARERVGVPFEVEQRVAPVVVRLRIGRNATARS